MSSACSGGLPAIHNFLKKKLSIDKKTHPAHLLGAVVRLLDLRGVAEQQQRESGQLPRQHAAPNTSRDF